MKNRVLSLAVAAVLAAPLASHAAPVTYDFTVNGGTSGPLANVTSSGSFTFDSSIIPAGVRTLAETGLFTGLSFTWDGQSYDQTSANTGWLQFISGNLNGLGFGTNCDAGQCMAADGSNGWFMDASHFVYAVPGQQLQSFTGTAAITKVAAAPEMDPATTAAAVTLLLGALAIVRGRRRKPVPYAS